MGIYYLVLIKKNHINIMEKISNKRKKDEVLNFLRRYILNRIFCFTTYQNLKMGIFWYLEVGAGTGCKIEKNPLFLQ